MFALVIYKMFVFFLIVFIDIVQSCNVYILYYKYYSSLCENKRQFNEFKFLT